MKNPKYVVITPVRNEADHVPKTIDSMVCQTILPDQWIVVDDGSTDMTPLILEEASKAHPWIHLIRRSDRGFRKPGGGVIEAFYEGYSAIKENDWDFLVKLDGDLAFETSYFQECFGRFASKPNLGIAGGAIYVVKNGCEKIDSQGDPPFHVRGATKIYRRACWEQISPLVRAPGWDTIDEVRANYYGWATQTFNELKLVQLKATGVSDGLWRNWFKNGVANYTTGYHPVFMTAKIINRYCKTLLLLAV